MRGIAMSGIALGCRAVRYSTVTGGASVTTLSRCSIVAGLALQAVLTSTAWAQSQQNQPQPAQPAAAPIQSAKPAASPKPLSSLAPASTQPKVGDVRPWAVGVHVDSQTRAKNLFVEGTDFLLRSLEEQAIAKYDEALGHWNHPGIHYNYAVALSTQDRPIETRQHLLEALRYGDNGPLDKLEVEQARRYLKLVESSLALIDIHTEQPGVVVSLNGQPLFTGPGQYHKFVAPDEYLVTATKPGYISTQQRVAFLPGRTNQVAVKLYSEQDLTRYKRLWPTWGPITVTAVGGLAVLGGGAAWLLADKHYDDYDAAVANACPVGCGAGDPALDGTESTRETAELYDAFALPLLIGGGVTLATGIVLLYVNRAEAYQITPQEAGVEQFSVVPVLGPSIAGLMGQGRF